MNEIQKPTSVVRMEFISALTHLINTCGLPPYIIEPVLKDMYHDVSLLTQRQAEEDMQKYQMQLKALENA